MKTAGLLYGPEFHHLDHLAPLCALLEIPLIVTDLEIASLARRFYPDLLLMVWDPREAPELLVAQFESVIYSVPRVLFEEVFYFAQALNRKRIETVWCPHGNSDKGRNSRFMEALEEEDLILTYGPRMEEFLREKGVNVPMQRVGNYRLAYYEKHKEFYDGLVPKKEKPIVLYAPTWQDREKSSSFPHFWKELFDCPDDLHVLVKLHPHLYKQYPEEVAQLRERVDLIENFPPVYPLLAQIDLFVGDKSSIGYDFLAFEKPMIHLCETDLPGCYLPPNEQGRFFERCRQLLGTKLETEPLYQQTFAKWKRADVKRLDILEQENRL